MIQINLLTEQKETHQLRDGNYGCQGERIVRELGMDVYTLLYIKCMTNKDLQYSTRNSAQCYVAGCMGGGFGENGYIHMYDLSLFAVPLKLSEL